MAGITDRISEYNRFGSVLGLERMNCLLEKLGNPHRELKVIHVAGTNGKGSVCRYLEGGLSACGYKVGLFTSPYIIDFRERIQIDGRMITPEELEDCGSRVLAAAEEMVGEGSESPTEFEIITAIALLFYKEQQVDLAVLEVGLGGKGDSTNVIEKPLVSVICSVSYDHMDRLGNTLEEIAAEKAGIIKPGVPVVSSVTAGEAAAVIARRAYETGSRLYDASKIKWAVTEETLHSQTVTAEIYEKDYSGAKTSMVGRHQAENLITALVTVEVLRRAGHISVDREKLLEGIETAVQPGRFEVFGENPAVIIDGAHNQAGAAALRKTAEHLPVGERILMVIGMLADKDVSSVLEEFTKITDRFIVTEPANGRRMKAEELGGILREKGIEPEGIFESIADATEAALSRKDGCDCILFAGSLYMISEVRKILVERYRNE